MIVESLHSMRSYFESGATRTFAFRKEQLKKLKEGLLKHEEAFHNALHVDLGKCPEESWVTETGFTLSEIHYTLKKLRQWMQPEKAKTNLLNFPSSCYIMREPLGVVLIIAPWNYPLQLLLNPLIGAIAAGNVVVLKPSEFAPATCAVLKKMIEGIFSEEYILYVEGDGAVVVPEMMKHFRFDHVFYTGSTTVGKIIYKMAAEKLVPVTLELGGKSPAVVEADANIRVAARRIAMTKFSNAGQMCVAPDYVLVHESVKEKFILQLKKTLVKFFTEDPSQSYGYCHIINEKQFGRLLNYFKDETIVHGGNHDKSKLYIEPTILDNVSLDAPVMKDEIFGPILPVIGFNNIEEAKEIILHNPNPLAFYVFTSNSAKGKRWLEEIPAGGACVNNVSWHLTNHHLPFGGRGNSGIGQYHGKNSFEVFSHRKAVMKTPTWFDPDIKYPPFKGKLKLFKWIVR